MRKNLFPFIFTIIMAGALLTGCGTKQEAADQTLNDVVAESTVTPEPTASSADSDQPSQTEDFEKGTSAEIVTPATTPTEVPAVTATTTPVPTEGAVETPTEVPTAEPTVTQAVEPTATPTVAPTSTPIPTATPKPTETPMPTATSTPVPTVEPTSIPEPTATPTATATPKPTSTPVPTATPTPIPETEGIYVDYFCDYYEKIAEAARNKEESLTIYLRKGLRKEIPLEDIPLVQTLAGMTVSYTAECAKVSVGNNRTKSVIVTVGDKKYEQIDITFMYGITTVVVYDLKDFEEKVEYIINEGQEEFIIYIAGNREEIANNKYKVLNKLNAVEYFSDSYDVTSQKRFYYTKYAFLYPDENDVIAREEETGKQEIRSWYEGDRETGVVFYLAVTSNRDWYEKTVACYQEWFMETYPDSDYTMCFSKLKTHPEDKRPEQRDSFIVCEIKSSEELEESAGVQEPESVKKEVPILTWEPKSMKEADYTLYKVEQELTKESRTSGKSEEELVKEVIDQVIVDGMSELEKVKAIYDYMLVNLEYAYYDFVIDEVTWESATVDSVLDNGYAVCQGYAVVFEALCKEAGLECIYVAGMAGGEAHAWNQVKVDGNWYNIDVTWGDPKSFFVLEDDHTFNNYKYFLLSDEDMIQDHVSETEVYACTAESIGYQALDMESEWMFGCLAETKEEVIQSARKAVVNEALSMTVAHEKGLFRDGSEVNEYVHKGICESLYSAKTIRYKEELERNGKEYSVYIIEFEQENGELIKFPHIGNREELYALIEESSRLGKKEVTFYAQNMDEMSGYVDEYMEERGWEYPRVYCNSFLDFDGSYMKIYLMIEYVP